MAGLDPVGLFARYGAAAKLTWSLPEQIANALVEGIIRGKFKPGERLLETELALRFGVSRGPVREAFRIVEKEGLVEVRPRYGAFVAKLSAKDVADIFEVRGILLSLAARRIAEKHDAKVLEDLDGGTAELEASVGNAERFLPVVYQYTMFVTARLDNELARGIIVSLARRTLHLTRLTLLSEANRRQWLADWRRMVKAIADDEPTEAEAAMRDIVANVGASDLEHFHRAPADGGNEAATDD
jgi:DNA-binding GntR family transcriptional regulator